MPGLVAIALGFGVVGLLTGLLVAPLCVGILIALGRLRYRPWLVGAALAVSLGCLRLSADYLYNLTHWTRTTSSIAIGILACIVLAAAPLLLSVLLVQRARRKVIPLAVISVAAVLVGISARAQFHERLAHDRAAYDAAIRLLSPATGTPFVRAGVRFRRTGEKRILLGHVPEGTRVTLLSSPFGKSFRARRCVGTASTYLLPSADPAVGGNATEIADLVGCDSAVVFGWAMLEKEVRQYDAVALVPDAAPLDAKVLATGAVEQSFRRLGYSPSDFDLPRATVRRTEGGDRTVVFVTAIDPLRRPRDMYPCADPALLVGLADPAHVVLVLPYCAVATTFHLNDELFIAATTQPPTPPGSETMNPEVTEWLFRVKSDGLVQIWPQGGARNGSSPGPAN
jgi:hypothetical protein